MKVTKILEEHIKNSTPVREITTEQLQREIDYFRSQRLLRTLLEKELITPFEFNKITELNRKTFSPFLAEIMPLNR
ncbi:SHOCT domain-containing protein [Clostridium tyrobutyricum]|uniref:SHOCT domain-containing protein n=1 Tax=Clostridium tyrobutyricum TaxID=1519 RepID=UPI00241C6B7A|nr:SHOCT domain-containing protein [Clostridium tyrobutyricum]